MDVAERLTRVKEQIAAACVEAGRSPREVRLVAVSKTHPVEAIRAAYAAGQRDFGENYAQELRDKARELSDLDDLRWHYVGRLQSNKARYIAPVCVRVHALDAPRHAEALAKRAPEGRDVPVLVSVNVAEDEAKSGTADDEALALCRELHAMDRIALKGLFTMPPHTDDPEDVAPVFARLRRLAERGRSDGLPLDELSMGMTHDFRVAIREGATWVRIGTAIFGERSYD